MDDDPTYTIFSGHRQLASGPLREVLRHTKQHHDTAPPDAPPTLIFRDDTGAQVDFNLRGPLDEVLDREAPAPAPRGRGRPKLGVVSREVSLLDRHWAWLEAQPGGASATLRRLIDEARRNQPERARIRQAQEATGRVMTTLGGDLPGYEEASRALYAGQRDRFTAHLQTWPDDLRAYVERLARDAFPAETA